MTENRLKKDKYPKKRGPPKGPLVPFSQSKEKPPYDAIWEFLFCRGSACTPLKNKCSKWPPRQGTIRQGHRGWNGIGKKQYFKAMGHFVYDEHQTKSF